MAIEGAGSSCVAREEELLPLATICRRFDRLADEQREAMSNAQIKTHNRRNRVSKLGAPPASSTVACLLLSP